MPRNLEQMLNTLPPESRRRVTKQTAATLEKMALHDLRRARRQTQVAAAQKMGVAQSEISKIETRSDLRLGTLQEYIRALGGTLELHAVFPETSIALEIGGKK